MTSAELSEHRFKQLEADSRATAARIDALVLLVDRVTNRADDHADKFSKLEGRLDERDKSMTKSLDRLHERLDERLSTVAHGTDVEALRTELAKLSADELREQGAVAERRRLQKQWFQITGATVAVLGLVAAIVFGLTQAL